MIETYKILTGKYDALVSPNMSIISSCITRGNDLQLKKTGLNMICGNIVSLTRLLIYGIVCLITLSANTTTVFKSRLDKFWQNQDIIYDFNTQLEGTRSRSVVQ